MPPRKRSPENRGLPNRWSYRRGAYYYQVPPGMEAYWDGKKLFRLGKTLPEAYRVWADRLEIEKNGIHTIRQLLDRYALEVTPTKSDATRYEESHRIKRLYAVFGDMRVDEIRPIHFYRYHDKREAKTAARLELALLGHALSKAVEWGIVDRHPTKGQVSLPTNKPRTRYVEDWEIVEALSLKPKRTGTALPMLQAYIRLKLLTGLSQGDLLRLRPGEHFKEDGIHVTRHKTAKSTGKQTIYEWTPELRKAVEEVRAARPLDVAPWLFCTRDGGCYVDSNGRTGKWKALWQDFMKRLLAETEVTERFTEHDLRAKVGSDADGLDHARALLSHADSRTTAAVYRRRPERVRPMSRDSDLNSTGGFE